MRLIRFYVATVRDGRRSSTFPPADDADRALAIVAHVYGGATVLQARGREGHYGAPVEPTLIREAGDFVAARETQPADVAESLRDAFGQRSVLYTVQALDVAGFREET